MSANRQILSRVAAIAVTALLLAVLCGALLWPLYTYNRMLDRQLAENRALAARLATGSTYQAQLAARYDTLRARVDRHGVFLTKETGTLAAAQVLDNVQGLISESGGTGRSAELLPVPENAPNKIRIRANFHAPYDVAARVIAAVEQTEPLLTIDRVQIRADPSGRGQVAGVLVQLDIGAERSPE